MRCYEVYAIRYARTARSRYENFIFRDAHEGPMPMDFFVWLLKCEDEAILVDTGFNRETSVRRNREFLGCPIDSLSLLGVDRNSIRHVVLTHLHYDHAGNLDKLPCATFHLQEEELQYATGRCMCHPPLRHAYAVGDVVSLIRYVYQDRVQFHSGRSFIAENVELVHVGGHTKGLQVVRVNTARGWVVLASDAVHYYENPQAGNPFPIVHNLADMLEGFRVVDELAESEQHIVPGHDPEVLRRYPCLPGYQLDIACLHKPPLREC